MFRACVEQVEAADEGKSTEATTEFLRQLLGPDSKVSVRGRHHMIIISYHIDHMISCDIVEYHLITLDGSVMTVRSWNRTYPSVCMPSREWYSFYKGMMYHIIKYRLAQQHARARKQDIVSVGRQYLFLSYNVVYHIALRSDSKVSVGGAYSSVRAASGEEKEEWRTSTGPLLAPSRFFVLCVQGIEMPRGGVGGGMFFFRGSRTSPARGVGQDTSEDTCVAFPLIKNS